MGLLQEGFRLFCLFREGRIQRECCSLMERLGTAAADCEGRQFPGVSEETACPSPRRGALCGRCVISEGWPRSSRSTGDVCCNLRWLEKRSKQNPQPDPCSRNTSTASGRDGAWLQSRAIAGMGQILQKIRRFFLHLQHCVQVLLWDFLLEIAADSAPAIHIVVTWRLVLASLRRWHHGGVGAVPWCFRPAGSPRRFAAGCGEAVTQLSIRTR
ncbi:MOB kinase activator 3A isoform X3 [Strix uralensis]|uniref:MOB kinase activator 3A isoform X3 n=1 Tax=Strix uralensis TaxID=36305 RepID=UPI003DA7711A